MKNGQKLAGLAGLMVLALAGGLFLASKEVLATNDGNVLVEQYETSVNEALAKAQNVVIKTANMSEADEYRVYLLKWIQVGEDFLNNPDNYNQTKAEEVVAALEEGAEATKLLTGIAKQERAAGVSANTNARSVVTEQKGLEKMEAGIVVMGVANTEEPKEEAQAKTQTTVKADIENSSTNEVTPEEEVEIPNTGAGMETYQRIALALAVVAVATGAIVNLIWGLEEKNA